MWQLAIQQVVFLCVNVMAPGRYCTICLVLAAHRCWFHAAVGAVAQVHRLSGCRPKSTMGWSEQRRMAGRGGSKAKEKQQPITPEIIQKIVVIQFFSISNRNEIRECLSLGICGISKD